MNLRANRFADLRLIALGLLAAFRANQFAYFRIIALGLLAVFLAWQIATKSIGDYLADVNPTAALHLQPSNPTALLNIAESRLPRGQPAQNAEPATTASIPSSDPNAEIRAAAQGALFNDPLNARALRILGQLALAGSDEEQAEKLLQAAAQRSLRESVAVY